MKNIWLSLFVLCSSAFAQAANLPTQISGNDLLAHSHQEVSAAGKKAMVVVFLSAKCPCSNSHLPELQSLAKDYPEVSFVAVHSNQNEPDALSAEYFKNAKLPFPVIQDAHASIAKNFKALKTPHAFVVLPDGKVAYQGGVSSSANFAEADSKFLRNALEDLKQNRPVKVSEGRTLGCVIDRG